MKLIDHWHHSLDI